MIAQDVLGACTDRFWRLLHRAPSGCRHREPLLTRLLSTSTAHNQRSQSEHFLSVAECGRPEERQDMERIGRLWHQADHSTDARAVAETSLTPVDSRQSASPRLWRQHVWQLCRQSPNNPHPWSPRVLTSITEGRSTMSTTATTIDPEHRRLEEVEMVGRDRWEEIHRRARTGGIDAGDRSRAGARPQDGAPLSAADGLEAVSAGGAHGHPAGRARGVSAAAGRGRGLLGAGAVPGAPAAGVRRKLRDGEAIRAAVGWRPRCSSSSSASATSGRR